MASMSDKCHWTQAKKYYLNDINPNTQKTNYKYLPAIFVNLTILMKTRQAGITITKFQTTPWALNIEIYHLQTYLGFLVLDIGIWCLDIICFLCIVFCDFKENQIFSPSSPLVKENCLGTQYASILPYQPGRDVPAAG